MTKDFEVRPHKRRNRFRFSIYSISDFVIDQDHKDSNLARYEEEEALQIQKRLLTSFNEEDLGLGMLLDHKARKVSADKLTDKNDVTILPMNLNEKQKLAFIKHESPEVHFLHADFEKYLNEIIYETSPIIDVLKNRKDLRNSGWTYLKHRHFCLINYCANISFYMAMRCSKDSEIIKDHPIVKRLLSYKKILTELEEHLNNNPTLSKELSFLKEAIKNNHQIKFKAQISDTDDNHSKSDDDDDSDVQNDIDHNESLWNDDANLEANLDEETKRAITYEMKKNKGLTPKRKREQRNPRVKYRKKFEKATVRRKGQVREPRKELKKYSGEFTGINMKSVKSIKFK